MQTQSTGFKSIQMPRLPFAATAVRPDVPTAEVEGKKLPKATKLFLLAGRALFTVSNARGDHFTYKVTSPRNAHPKYGRSYFVSVKAAGEGWPYKYIGILDPVKGTIKCTAKSNFLPGTKEYDVANWATSAVINGKLIPDTHQIQHAGMCGKCGRTLTTPESIERGIGPECWARMQGRA